MIPMINRRTAWWLSLLLFIILELALGWFILSTPARADDGWRRYLDRACARYGCDVESRTLLLAIASHEPDWREEQSIGDDLRSFGRWQIHIKTAIRIKYGRGYERRILLKEYANLIFLLGDEAFSSDMAVSIMTECQRHNRTARSRALCYHGKATPASHARYLAIILPIYDRLRKGEQQ